MSKALILEDAPGLQRVIFSKLKQEGYEVTGSDNVTDAIKILNEGSNFTLFWIDHTLVGENTGLDFLKVVKKIELYKSTLAILVTNLDDQETIDEYVVLGIDKYYHKSDITISEVIADIRNSLV